MSEIDGPAASASQNGVQLPHLNADRWMLVRAQLQGMTDAERVEDVVELMQPYLPQDKKFARFWNGSKLDGLTAALSGNGGGDACYESFFKTTLKYIAKKALELPDRMASHDLTSINVLSQLNHGDAPTTYSLPREVCMSLLANLFLLTLDEDSVSSASSPLMPEYSFLRLLCTAGAPHEHAKLRMFIHYFERCYERDSLPSSPALGKLHFIRRRVDFDEGLWMQSVAPLLKMEVVPPMIGFENEEWGHDCLHADFANKYLGGGVLSGGCVQEEIRFAICPELVIGVLICQVMTDREAIQIVGAEQFSAYSGYMFKLRYAGDFKDTSKTTADGTVLNGIAAIDALDGRSIRPFGLDVQMRSTNMLRELNKASAGFTPPSAQSLQTAGPSSPFSHLATGNWGCGVFGGFSQLKAVLQWIAASQGGIKVRYFPFNEEFGPDLQTFADSLVKSSTTVGQLWAALLQMSDTLPIDKNDSFLNALSQVLMEKHSKSKG
eukprot:CAMPEP_0179410576 /NCGR_PEP_ID=MMETSP0799-20121207/3377_1 /TAXON_ID=46947 /ORGANISM="Geminigera cryophila, Strain CCMP2564" /LENGTH=492 /DNA_ID=CAMNT_0021182467 /DNA_START=6 /DNA_END=1484 /DNA_ORIENTATION=-